MPYTMQGTEIIDMVPACRGQKGNRWWSLGRRPSCSLIGWSPNPVKETHRISELGNLSFSPVLVIYSCLKIFPRLRGFKQHISIISQFLWIWSPGKVYLGPLLNIPYCSQEVSWGCDLIWSSTRKRSAAVEGEGQRYPLGSCLSGNS